MIQALEISYQIWNDPEYTSKEIVKIRKVLKAMIAKLRNRPVDSPLEMIRNPPRGNLITLVISKLLTTLFSREAKSKSIR